jgi:hypothetical protein
MVGGCTMVGKLQRVQLREVWKHEAHNFTAWLETNIDVVNDATGLHLDNVSREQAAGSFSVDLVAEDEAGGLVIIENQLEKSDHDHLGKLLTYLAAFEAQTAIWIVSDPRPEHTAVLNWLNQTTPASFYLLKVEGIRIDDSLPAPLLTLIVRPTEEGRQVGQVKNDWAKNQEQLERFWSNLLKLAQERTDLHAEVRPSKSNWLPKMLGTSGVQLAYVVSLNGGRVELYIGNSDPDYNRRVFDKLHMTKDEIEHELGEPLKWDRREGGTICKVEWHLPVAGYRDEASWPSTQNAMVDAMVRLERALRSRTESILGAEN